jgi:hypothetical protein
MCIEVSWRIQLAQDSVKVDLLTCLSTLRLIKHHTMKRYEEWRYTSTHSEPRHWMEMSGQLHVPAALYPRKEALLPIW